MKNFTLCFFVFLALVLAFSSCSFTKRHYRNGFFVEWKQHHHTPGISNSKKKAQPFLLPETDTFLLRPQGSANTTHTAISNSITTPEPRGKKFQAETTSNKKIVFALSAKKPATSLQVKNTASGKKHLVRQKKGFGGGLDLSFMLVLGCLLVPPALFSVFCPSYVEPLALIIIWIVWLGLLFLIFSSFFEIWLIVLLCAGNNLLSFIGGLWLVDVTG